MGVNDTEHIWLRQTVTFTVDGQTRTLEIGIPIPRDATAQDVEALLGVADSGMHALTRRLDAQIAATLTNGAASQAIVTESGSVSSAPTLPAASQEVVSPNSHTSVDEAPPPTMTAELTRTAEQRASAKPAIPERPATPPRPASEPQRTQSPSTPPARPVPAASDSQGEMTRPQFLAAVAELGLNPRQAMDRLVVRSLEGLNLREALESLRRQLLGASSAMEPEPEPMSTRAPGHIATPSKPETPAAPTAAHYFEEEDDETILYSLDEDNDLSDDDLTPSIGDTHHPSVEDALEEIDIEDVPDLTPPPASIRQRTTPATRKAPVAVREEQAAPSGTPASGARTQAMQLIGKLRAANGGGAASDYQRNAYHNIVEEELGKAQATTLVRGLWRTTPDKLSSAQLDALIRWGKEEVFSEEAAQVLATLRAEQRRAEQTAASAKDAEQPAAPRSTPRARPSGGQH